MKQITIVCAFIAYGFICEGQILKNSLTTLTPEHKEMYKNAIKKGRGQKAVGALIIIGGAALGAFGAVVAIKGIPEAIDADDDCTEPLEWKGGTAMFWLGLGTVAAGSDLIRRGRQNVQQGKLSLKINSRSAGLLVKF
jgi:hypothetical protein